MTNTWIKNKAYNTIINDPQGKYARFCFRKGLK